MTTPSDTEKIKALESRVETLQAMVETLGARLAVVDIEHADTRFRVLSMPGQAKTQGSVVEIETQGSISEK